MVANNRSRSARLDTSPCTASTERPTVFAASSRASWRRPVMTTLAPSAANNLAVANPMPLLPPVTSATFPVSFAMTMLLKMGYAAYPKVIWKCRREIHGLHDDHHAKPGLIAQHPLVTLGRFFQRHGFDHGLDLLENAESQRVFVVD